MVEFAGVYLSDTTARNLTALPSPNQAPPSNCAAVISKVILPDVMSALVIIFSAPSIL